MSSPAQRLLRLISLLQARGHWSGAALSERLGVDRRSIRRDIERLRELGYPVQASAGVGGGYRLGGGAPVLPLLLDEDEATAIALALRAATASMGGMEDTARRVLSKLEPLVPVRRRHEAGDLHAATSTLSEAPAVDMALLGRLAHACRTRALLAFDYSSHSGTLTRRRVEAQHLVTYLRRWYLLAWDCERQDWRTLRVDRLTGLVVEAAQGMQRRTPQSPEAMVRHAVSRAPFLLQAEVTLRGSAAELGPQLPPWCGVPREDGPGQCVLQMGADSAAMLAGQILSLGRPVLAIATSPPALAAALRDGLEQVLGVLAPGSDARPA